MEFQEVLWISSQAILAIKFLSQIQTDIFQKKVRSCLKHPKTCKCIENRKSNFFSKPIPSSTSIEENKKKGNKINNDFIRKICFKTRKGMKRKYHVYRVDY